MRVLLLGGTGQVGTEIRRLASVGVDLDAPSRERLDLTRSGDIARAVSAQPWDAVINAAAYTEVDRAESEEALAFAINAQACETVATETARHGIPLIHISTDYVYDGRKGAPYVEADPVAPLNVYGRSKLAGERAIAAGNSRHIILRTSWVYSAHRKNFVKTILRLAAERDRLTIVDDQRGCPTAARDIATACIALAHRIASGPETGFGIYHFAGDGETTWFAFAKTIIELAGHTLARRPDVVPIKTSQYPTPAVRPTDTRLDCTAISEAFGLKGRPWKNALAETVAELTANRSIS
jgi:dTDP-4-dehydrorhamnose reductase